LDEWPTVNKKVIDKKMIVGMRMVRDFSALGLAKRAEAGIKVRQPLASMTIGAKLTKELERILADEVNVKKILIDKKLKSNVVLDVILTPELRAEGVRRDIARMVQELRQKAELQPKDRIAIFLALPEEAATAIRASERTFMSDLGAKSISYIRSDKFDAEESGKWEGKEIWIGLRKL
jgi:isoleucyl-tRNA synthetase